MNCFLIFPYIISALSSSLRELPCIILASYDRSDVSNTVGSIIISCYQDDVNESSSHAGDFLSFTSRNGLDR